jgi:DtxR family transcriptional regulator, Mn-dependent transcriptional regulator
MAVMSDAAPYLLFGAIVAVLVGWLFWPQGGFVWRRRESWEGFRIRVEDALKYLYYCETEAQHPSITSVAGRLQLSEDQALALIQSMQAHGLLEWKDEQLQLTPDGRAYALHIVRAHRLWERYLAEKTGYAETRWHAQAEEIEHKLSVEETDELASRLGYPLMDPHGDPIPTAAGELAGPRGQPLTTLSPGAAARITHLEDEPEAVFAQLIAQGLYPGLIVHLLERTPQYLRVWAAGDEHRLASIVAAAVAVEPIARPLQPAHVDSLADLTPPASGRIREISRRCRGAERRRLLDLGIVPGTLVTAELVSPSGDPTAYRIRDTLIALRREQAVLIEIERDSASLSQGQSNGKEWIDARANHNRYA